MINPADYAIQTVCAVIPNAVLDIAIKIANKKNSKDYDLKTGILEYVVNGRVSLDSNINGGNIVRIPLENCQFEVTNDEDADYIRVPPSAVNSLDITEVVDVEYDFGRNSYTGIGVADSMINNAMSNPLQTAKRFSDSMLQSKTFSPRRRRYTPKMLQGGLVKITPKIYAETNLSLVCRLGYDKAFTNMNSSAVKEFASLVLVAVKQFCYNNLIDQVDSGFISFGVELPAIKDIISDWRDIEDVYQDKLNIFTANAGLDIDRLARTLRWRV